MSPKRLAVWPPLSPRIYLQGKRSHLPFPLEQEDCRLYARARHALWNGCRALGLKPGDEVLVPAYHHGSEVEAILRAGLGIRFFDASDSLEPDPRELDRLLAPSVRALLLIHYLGFPQDAARWKAWCEERSLLLLEDAAQAWLAHIDGIPVGSFGDLSIFCMYKMVGIPDGAALMSRLPPPRPRAGRTSGIYGVMKRHGAWLAQRNAVASRLLSPVSTLAMKSGTRDGSHAREFELGDPFEPPSVAATWLLPRALDTDVAERRRRNYRSLLDELGEHVPEPFASLPEGACPFAFPIRLQASGGFVERLEAHGAKAVLLWKHPHPSLPVDVFPKARDARENLLALPVHQELTQADLAVLVRAVRRALR